MKRREKNIVINKKRNSNRKFIRTFFRSSVIHTNQTSRIQIDFDLSTSTTIFIGKRKLHASINLLWLKSFIANGWNNGNKMPNHFVELCKTLLNQSKTCGPSIIIHNKYQLFIMFSSFQILPFQNGQSSSSTFGSRWWPVQIWPLGNLIQHLNSKKSQNSVSFWTYTVKENPKDLFVSL